MDSKLLEMCVYIAACSNLDIEVTLAGNRTNSFEAYNVVREILRIYEFDLEEFNRLVLKEMERLEN